MKNKNRYKFLRNPWSRKDTQPVEPIEQAPVELVINTVEKNVEIPTEEPQAELVIEPARVLPQQILDPVPVAPSTVSGRMLVNLLVVATNKYVGFVPVLLDSADRFFLTEHDVTYNIFTNNEDGTRELLKDKPYLDRIRFFHVEHRPFPYPTLYRFHFFKEYIHSMFPADYFFYVDVDCAFVDKVSGQDILYDRVAVQHCGFIGERGTYETDERSTSYVSPYEGNMYYGGGFWGFSTGEFLVTCTAAVKMIDADAGNNIVPCWHDESVLNRLFINNPPVKVLTPSFHFPESNDHIMKKWRNRGRMFKPVLLLLDKNHAEMRK